MEDEHLEKLEYIFEYLGEVKDQINVILQHYLEVSVKDISQEDFKKVYSVTQTLLRTLFRTLEHEHRRLGIFIEHEK